MRKVIYFLGRIWKLEELALLVIQYDLYSVFSVFLFSCFSYANHAQKNQFFVFLISVLPDLAIWSHLGYFLNRLAILLGGL